MMSIKRIVGIDFGTSSTYIKVKHYEDDTAKDDRFSAQYVDFNGNAWVPTVIQKLDDNYWYGYDAQTKKSNNSVIYRNFKMSLENKDENLRNEARQLTELFFKYIFRMYQDQFSFDKYDEIETIVSYPAKWHSDTVEFLEYVAMNAGFQNVRSMDEPTAALNAVLIQNTSRIIKAANIEEGKPFYIMMIDMGAGTTDFAVLKCYMQNFNGSTGSILSRIITTWPNSSERFCFGGREVEEYLYKYLKKYLLSMANVSEKMAENILNPQMDSIKSWKENTVSSSLNKNIEVSNCQFLDHVLPLITDEPVPMPVLDRRQFESELEKYLESFVDLINGCIDETWSVMHEINCLKDIDLVILTGGHSQWYFVRDILNGKIKKVGSKKLSTVIESNERIISLARPQETVSLGLVYTPLQLKLEPKNEPLMEFDKSEDRYCYVNFNKVIYKVDKLGHDLPYRVRWIELIEYERPDSLASIISKKFNASLEEYSLNTNLICKEFMFFNIDIDSKRYLVRVNLEEPFPNPIIVYEPEGYMDMVSYGGVLFIVEEKDHIKKVSQLSLDGTKKRFLFNLNSIQEKFAEEAYIGLRFADDKNLYFSYASKKEEYTFGGYILQINYTQNPVTYKLLDKTRNTFEVFINGKYIYYYNEDDGICAMNTENYEKRCLVKGNNIVIGVSDNFLVYSEALKESKNGLYSMDLNSNYKKLIEDKIIGKAKVVGEWIIYHGKISPKGKTGAFFEKFVIHFPGVPYCIKTDGTSLYRL
jgi:hypothetical protein